MKLLIALVLGLLSLGATPPQKPVVEKPFHLPNRSTVETTDKMWEQSAIVIEGVVTSSRTVVTPPIAPNDRFPLIQTAHDIQVLEVFKADARVTQPGQRITVRQTGGDLDKGTHIERLVPDGIPIYTQGARYILFLQFHDLPASPFYSNGPFGPDGVYKVTNGRIETPSTREMATRNARKSVDAFRGELRALRGRQVSPGASFAGAFLAGHARKRRSAH
jgi:hypothetical protein